MSEEIKQTIETVTIEPTTIEEVKQVETVQLTPKTKKVWLSEKKLNAITMVIASTLLTCLCLSPMFYLLNKKIPKPVGVIDLQALVNENQNAIINTFSSSPEITDEQRAVAMRKTQEFAIKLNKAVANKAIECGCVLVNKAAVLTEKQEGVVVDYTDAIRKEVK